MLKGKTVKNIKKFLFGLILIVCLGCFAGCDFAVKSGKSAYEIAVENGFNGTVTEWLESLKGESVAKGDSAYDIAVKHGFEGSEIEWLQSLKGKDGTNGANGQNGTNGADGKDVTASELFNLAVEYGLYTDDAQGYADFLSNYLLDNVGTLNVEKISAECLNKVVSIYCEDDGGYETLSAGAGVFYKINNVAKEAFVITNFHVVTMESTSGFHRPEKINMYLYGSESIALRKVKKDSQGNYVDYTEQDEQNNVSFTYLVDYGKNAIEGEFIGGSAAYDLAVIKVSGNSFEKIRNSSCTVAEIVDTNNIQLSSLAIAIGNPMGSGVSVSTGFVSCDSENITVNIENETRVLRCIRIDTAINPGNSGGGIFNENGGLIGIVNARSTKYTDINYAIPGSNVKSVVDNILYFYTANYNPENEDNTTQVHKYIFGITIQAQNSKSVYNSINKTQTLFDDCVITQVNENSIAQELGFEVGDIISKVIITRSGSVDAEEFDITRMFILTETLLTVRPGDKVEFEYKRFNEDTNTYQVGSTMQHTILLQNYIVL